MQPHNSNDQRTPESDSNGRWDAEQSAVQGASGLVLPQVPDVANRTVCLSAGLTGNGGVTA